MTRLGKHHTAVVGDFRSGGGILEELAAGALVVLLVAVNGAGSVLFVHLGKMVDMARCRLHHKSALRAGLRGGFRCGRTRRVRHYGIMVRRVAAADMGVAIGLLVSPGRGVKVVVIVEVSVRDLGKGGIVHVKQLAAEIALLISVPALLGAVGVLRREGGEGTVIAGSCLDLNGAGGRFCSCRCGNGRFTGGYGGHLARGGIDGCNIGLARRPYHRVGRTFRCDRRYQAGVTITGSQRQLALIKSDTGRRLLFGSDGDHSAVGIIVDGVVCVFRVGKEEVFLIINNRNDRFLAGSHARLHLAGKGCQQRILGAGILTSSIAGINLGGGGKFCRRGLQFSRQPVRAASSGILQLIRDHQFKLCGSQFYNRTHKYLIGDGVAGFCGGFVRFDCKCDLRMLRCVVSKRRRWNCNQCKNHDKTKQ